jgi:hypothetical protein
MLSIYHNNNSFINVSYTNTLHTDIREGFLVNRHSNKGLDIKDIALFKKGGARNDNDANNKKREIIIEQLVKKDVPDEYFADLEYGSQWTHIDQTLNEQLTILSPEYDTVTIERKGGRKYNYDFIVSFVTKEIVTNVFVEFKFGASFIENLPQIYSRSTEWELTTIPYHCFFYDRIYLDEICSLNNDTIKKPTREIYLKYVTNNKYDSHPFFRTLYDLDEKDDAQYVEKKKVIVKRSICEFLQQYGNTLDIAEFQRTIQLKQTGKQYLLYDPKKKGFSCRSSDEFYNKDIMFHSIRNHNTVVLRTDTHEFTLLLRWKNRQGVIHTGWQVGIRLLKNI